MNCHTIRELLPLAVYGDLSPSDAADVTQHLAECPSCETEHAAIIQVRRALNAGTPPIECSEIGALLRLHAERATLRLRRWRRAALAASALAAGLLVVLVSRLQFDRTLSPPAISASPAPEFVERLQLVQETTRALIMELEARDGVLRSEIGRLQNELADQQRLNAERWIATERDVTALYKTTFSRPEKGE